MVPRPYLTEPSQCIGLYSLLDAPGEIQAIRWRPFWIIRLFREPPVGGDGKRGKTRYALYLPRTDQELRQSNVIAEAIQAGLIKSPGEALDIAVDALQKLLKASQRPIPAVDPVDAEEWMRKFRAWAHSHPTTTPLLSDEAIGREAIYRERGL
jgi:hypothetical protein